MLFLSSRSQLISEVIKKNIKINKFILCDRFTDSTLAYQGYGRGLNNSVLNSLNGFATENIEPDLTFILDISLSELTKRIQKGNIDRMEKSGLQFLDKVRMGYREIANKDKSRYILLDCVNKSIKEVNNQIIEFISKYYGIQ